MRRGCQFHFQFLPYHDRRFSISGALETFQIQAEFSTDYVLSETIVVMYFRGIEHRQDWEF